MGLVKLFLQGVPLFWVTPAPQKMRNVLLTKKLKTRGIWLTWKSEVETKTPLPRPSFQAAHGNRHQTVCDAQVQARAGGNKTSKTNMFSMVLGQQPVR